MIRGLLRLVLVIVVIVVAGAFLLGWWGGGHIVQFGDAPATVGTSGVDRDKARAVGAEAGERTAVAAEKAGQAAEKAADKTAQIADRAGEQAAYAADQTRKALADGSLTAKIKAKMALDDHVKALDLNVDTRGTVVTVSGTVNTQAEKDRALLLARETAGVTQVIDKVSVR